jgi:hypothetical protein
MKNYKILSIRAIPFIFLAGLFSYTNNSCEKDSCKVSYEFTTGNNMTADYVMDICNGKGDPGYSFSHFELSIEDKGTYSVYSYKCIYCK